MVGDMRVLSEWVILDSGEMYVIPKKDPEGNLIRMIGVKRGNRAGGFLQDRLVLFNHTNCAASIKWIGAYGLDDEEPGWFKEMAYQYGSDWADDRIEWYKWTEINMAEETKK